MTTLLVTTDFSANSKAGIRFALQLTAQTLCKLVFYHAIELLTPTQWSKEDVAEFVETERKIGQESLRKFLHACFKQANMEHVSYDYVAEMGTDVDHRIIKYAEKVNADFICMSTRGAGTLQKIIGTNASTLVNTSPIPVIVVPKNYRAKPITKIGYPTDFENVDTEVQIVQKLAALVPAKVDVFHFYYELHKAFNHAEFDRVKAQYQSESVTFHEPKICIEYSLVENIQRAITKEKTSLLVMFTKQKQNWFERFFFESKTSAMTFDMKIPLVAFRK